MASHVSLHHVGPELKIYIETPTGNSFVRNIPIQNIDSQKYFDIEGSLIPASLDS